jgi:tetrapyrrole methylase family protein / MazG family protein
VNPVARGRVEVVGLGPAGADLLTDRTRELLDCGAPVFVRTFRHPAAEDLNRGEGPLVGATGFDEVYEASATLPEVYETIVARLVGEAVRHGTIVYAVPGSPGVAEQTVALLVGREAEVDVVVHPAVSFADLAWARLGIDPLAEGVRLVDGQRFATQAADATGPLLVAQCDTTAVLSAVKLAVDDPPSAPVVVLQRLGLPGEAVAEVAWEDLDRAVEPDHLTSLYIAELVSPVAGELVALTELMHTLRAECPWDRRQTHQSLVRHLVEETYEVVEAIEALPTVDVLAPGETLRTEGVPATDAAPATQGDAAVADAYEALEEELGDLLFQVVFHAELAAEQGRFRLADVARTVHDKLHARHPHVFGDVEVHGAEGVEANWERLKQAEKQRASAMDGIPAGLPALLVALKTHERAHRAGMPFAAGPDAFAEVAGELDELRADPGARELGDVLFAAVGLAAGLDVEPEAALRAAAARFAARFRHMEAAAANDGVALGDVDDRTLDRWWRSAKAATDGAAPDASGSGQGPPGS